jgi:hypothetical protein
MDCRAHPLSLLATARFARNDELRIYELHIYEISAFPLRQGYGGQVAWMTEQIKKGGKFATLFRYKL